MAEHDDAERVGSSAETGTDAESAERMRPVVTRRDFLVGAGTGAVVVGAVAGAGIAVTRGNVATAPAPVQTGPGGPAVVAPPVPGAPAAPAKPGEAQPAAAPAKTLPATMRNVTLDIDGKKHDVAVDVRESLWETMIDQLGEAGANLGCDRAQCGACTVLVDGRPVNGCTVLTARLGRGQKIMTVASLAQGPGLAGLHPIQKAFWQDGGFQCGICTRGFIMSTYALLQTTKSPTDDQIAEGLAGNVCRCGEYSKIFTSVKSAAAEMRGEKVQYLAPVTVVEAEKPKPAAAAANVPGTSKDFEFATPLATIEEFEPIAEKIRERDGILAVSGSERTISVKWADGKLDEAAVRKLLADLGHPVK